MFSYCVQKNGMKMYRRNVVGNHQFSIVNFILVLHYKPQHKPNFYIEIHKTTFFSLKLLNTLTTLFGAV